MVPTALSWRLAGFYFWYFAFLGVFGTYFALYLQSLGLAAAEIAVLMSSQQVVRIVTPFFWGWLADRLHRRTAIIRATLLAAGVLFGLLFFVTTYRPMLAVFVAMFVFWSAALPLFEASVLAITGGDSGRYARIRLWGSIGFIVAVLVVGSALDHLSLGALLPIVLGLLVVAIASACTLPEQAPPLAGEAPRDSVWPVLRRPAVAGMFVACFLMMASQSAMFIFYSIHMVASGHSKGVVGVLWSTGVVAEIIIFLILPRLNTRFSAFQLFAFSYVVTVFRYLLVAWLPASLAVQLFAQALHAFTFGTWHSAAMALLHRHFPGRLGTRGQALYTSFSFGVGGALGGLVAGFVWDGFGSAWTFTLMSAFAAMGGAVVWRTMRAEPH